MDVAWTSAVMTKAVTPQVARSVGDELPFKNGVFDYVFFIDSFEHMPDQAAVIREAYRVLAKNGKIFLSVPNYSNVCGIVKKIGESLGLYAKDSWAPFDGWAPQVLERFMTPGSIRKIASACGFRKVTMIGGYRDFIDGIFPWVDHKLMPGAPLVRAVFSYIEKPLNRVFPWLSLHNFWAIEK
jgi:SAM-dependent methyltransferase